MIFLSQIEFIFFNVFKNNKWQIFILNRNGMLQRLRNVSDGKQFVQVISEIFQTQSKIS